MKMDNVERISKLKDNEYQQIFGVKKATFEIMLEILQKQYQKEHIKGGKPSKLSVLDKLVITLGYYREYRTMQHIAFDYNVVKSTICDSIHWVEDTLVKSGVFSLPSKSELYDNPDIETILIDATEVEIERPKKSNKDITQVKRKNIL